METLRKVKGKSAVPVHNAAGSLVGWRKPANSAEAFYIKHGFDIVGTGGNCDGFIRHLDMGGLHILVTAQDQSLIPTEAEEPVTVGLYCEQDSEPLAEFNAPDGLAVMTRLSNGQWDRV